MIDYFIFALENLVLDSKYSRLKIIYVHILLFILLFLLDTKLHTYKKCKKLFPFRFVHTNSIKAIELSIS